MAHAMHINALPPHYAAGPFDNDNGRLPPISASHSFSHHFGPPILAASSSRSPSVIPAPMAIRGADRPTFVPPPLPPPRLVPIDGPVDPTLQSKEYERECMMRERNGSSGSWYPDSFGHSVELPPRRCDPFSPPRTELDEGYHSLDVSRSSELPSLLGSHPVNVFRPIGRKANHDIDNDMINKLNGRRSGLSASLSNMAPFTRSPVHVTPGGSSGLSLFNNNNRNSNNNNNGASPFGHRPARPPSDHRPAEIGASNKSELEHSPLPSMRRNDSNSFPDDATVSTQTSLEAREDEAADFLSEETRRVRRLDIGEGFNFSATGRDRDWEWEREREWQLREAERDPFCSRQGQAGHKRRASSPPSEEFVSGGNSGGGAGQAGPLASDMVKRRDGGGGGGGLVFPRGSPTLRHPGMPQQPGDASSVGTTATSRSGNLSLTTGALNPNTSLFMRLSPPALSPGGVSTGVSSPVEPVGAGSPFSSSTSGLGRALQQQQQQSQTLPKSGQQHQLVVGEAGMTGASQAVRTVMTPPRKLGELSPSMSKHTAMKRKAPFMCECCPKKPKKFDTEEELSLHAAEKQYTCQYCGNRFKNKNEAERHQNSLHVRSHSWSCSALTARGYERAFHDSTVRPGEADVCGYCGDEFSRSGPRAPLLKMESLAAGGGATGGGGAGGGGGDDVVMGGTDDAGAPAETDAASAAAAQGARQVTEADWEKRMDHLQNVHKFRECNASKKFFRADHFRQHLKHSHGGTSGKWTNMLENACMTEEEPPTPLPTARA